MKSGVSRIRRGFTLIEMTVAMVIGMAISAIVLLLLNQQLTFYRIYRAQDFLTREAPLINNYLIRVVGSAEAYRLYGTIEDFRNGEDPVMDDAKVLLMRYREADGSTRASLLSFEDPGTGAGSGLYYRLVPVTGTIGNPDWAVSKQPADVTFSIQSGILRMTLTGPNGEQLVYSGTEQL